MLKVGSNERPGADNVIGMARHPLTRTFGGKSDILSLHCDAWRRKIEGFDEASNALVSGQARAFSCASSDFTKLPRPLRNAPTTAPRSQ